MNEWNVEEQKEKLQRLHELGYMSEKQLKQVLEGLVRAEQVSEVMTGRRSNVVSVRLSDEVLRCLDDMVSAGIAQSRSEAASILIVEGIKSRASLFTEIRKHTDAMEDIRRRLQESIQWTGLGKFDSELTNDHRGAESL